MATGALRPQFTRADEPLLPGPLRPTTAPQLPQLPGSGRRRGSVEMGQKTWVMPRAVAVAPATYYLSPRKGGVPASLVGRDAARAAPAFAGLRAASARGLTCPWPMGSSAEDLRAEAPYTHRPTTGTGTTHRSGSMHRTFKVDTNYVNLGLERVRARVQEEATSLDRGCRDLPEFSNARLEMHQHAMNRLLTTFRGYAPAFAKIKAEYDRAIAKRHKDLIKAREQAIHMNALNCGYDLELPATRERYEHAMRPDREALYFLQKQIAEVDEIVKTKQAMLDIILTKFNGAHDNHEELEEQQQVLATGMKAKEFELKQIFADAVDSDSSVWKTKNGIELARVKHKVRLQNLDQKATDQAKKDLEKAELCDFMLYMKILQ